MIETLVLYNTTAIAGAVDFEFEPTRTIIYILFGFVHGSRDAQCRSRVVVVVFLFLLTIVQDVDTIFSTKRLQRTQNSTHNSMHDRDLRDVLELYKLEKD